MKIFDLFIHLFSKEGVYKEINKEIKKWINVSR
jgi:hypothetical protein